MTYVESLMLLWQIAAAEAAWKKHQFVEKEHLFIALCKAHEFLTTDLIERMGLGPSAEIVEEMKKELHPVRLRPGACAPVPWRW